MALFKFKKRRKGRGQRTPVTPRSMLKPETESADAKKDGADNALKTSLPWLIDAPLFIDEVQVEAMYDAVLKPEFEGVTAKATELFTEDFKLSGGLTAGGLIPGPLSVGIKGHADAEKSRGEDQGLETSATLVSNPYRHLILLVAHYLAISNQIGSDRLTVVKEPVQYASSPLFDDNFIEAVPRPLIMLELSDHAALTPAAMEVNGGVKNLSKPIRKKTEENLTCECPREYLGSFKDRTESDRRRYWNWLIERVDPLLALDVVENEASGKSVSWIDYRCILRNTSDVVDLERPILDLSLRVRGRYDAGIFGRAFIKRAARHGLRIVGTVKRGPGINVLAVFER